MCVLSIQDMLKVSSSLVSQVNKAVDEEVRKKKSITKKVKKNLLKSVQQYSFLYWLWLDVYTFQLNLKYSKALFTWSGGPQSSGVGFFCFVSPRAWKQKKPTPLDRGRPLHVNRPLYNVNEDFFYFYFIEHTFADCCLVTVPRKAGPIRKQ